MGWSSKFRAAWPILFAGAIPEVMSLVPKPLSSQRTKKCLFMFKMKILLLPSIATKNDLHSVTKDVSINFGMNLCWLRKKRNKHPFWTPLRKKIFKTFKNKIGSSNAIFRLHHAASQTDDTQVFVDVFGYFMFPAGKKKKTYTALPNWLTWFTWKWGGAWNSRSFQQWFHHHF